MKMCQNEKLILWSVKSEHSSSDVSCTEKRTDRKTEVWNYEFRELISEMWSVDLETKWSTQHMIEWTMSTSAVICDSWKRDVSPNDQLCYEDWILICDDGVADVLTHLFTDPLTCRLTDLLTYWFTNLLIYWLADLLIYWSTDFLTYWLPYLLTCWCTDLLAYWPADLLTCWFIDLLIYWLTGLLT